MIVNSSSIQSRNPLDNSASKPVSGVLRSPNTAPDDEKVIETQKQADAKKQADIQKQVDAQEQADANILLKLRARDSEVRAHEAAHTAAGGSLVRGGASYTYQTGPDGRAYAIGGEVQLDVSAVANNPQATLEKAGQIRAAALAPADPSSQDLRIASNANQLAARARVDLAVQRREETKIDENEQTVEALSSASENTAESEPVSGSLDNPESISGSTVERPVESAPPTPPISASLRSNEPAAAAISNFMATAQTDVQPVLLNRFA